MVKSGRKLAGKESSIVALEELNLVEFPLAVLSDYAPDGQKTLQFFDHIEDAASGKTLNRSVTITGADAWGLPNWQDQDVLLALMLLTEQKHGFEERKINFSLYELCKLLRWDRGGNRYDQLAESLDRWIGVTIKYSHWRFQNRWKQNEAFHIIERYKLTNGRQFDADEMQSLTWNDVVWENLRNGHRKALNWNFYLNLKTPTAKRLYRFLDKRFFLKRSWKFDLGEFGWNKIGISIDCPVWKIKERLRPAIKELEAKRFLKPIDEKHRYKKIGKGLFEARFERTQFWDKSNCPQQTPKPKSNNPLEAALLKRKVTNAVELVAKYSSEQIACQIENYDDRIKDGAKLSPGWLRKAIEENYGFRKGYKSQAERDAISKRVAARQKAIAKNKARADALEKEKREKEKKAFVKFLDSFENDESRDVFQDEALRANSLLRRQYNTAETEERAADYLEVALFTHWKSVVS